MSGTMTDTTIHKAVRKKHRCEWCGELIDIGDTYHRYRWFQHGEAGVCKMHPECMADMQTAAHDEGGWIEFTPHCADRPLRILDIQLK